VLSAAIANRLIPTRALMAVESFRQLILDAQAMMDPDFAGKLSADVAAGAESDEGADTGFGFGAAEADSASAESAASFDFGGQEDQLPLLDSSNFSPFTAEAKRPFLVMPKKAASQEPAPEPAEATEEQPAFRAPGDAATLPELIKFLIDRTGYIKALETEGSPEAFSRIENLKELANAARDAETRGETLAEFLDNAALASDSDQFDPDARVTLMTLHGAKGLEFSLVFLAGLEEGLFPHSRTLNNPDELEEERRRSESDAPPQPRWVVHNVIRAQQTVRLTVTYPVINQAKAVWFLVTGAKKAQAFAQADVPGRCGGLNGRENERECGHRDPGHAITDRIAYDGANIAV